MKNGRKWGSRSGPSTVELLLIRIILKKVGENLKEIDKGWHN